MATALNLRFVAIALAAALCGCAVGPDFKRPEAPAAPDYGKAGLAQETTSAGSGNDDAQRFVADKDVVAQWWTLYRSHELDRMIELALQGNPSVESAKAALRQAQELHLAQRASYFPSVSAGLGASRNLNPNDTLANPTVSPSSEYNLYTAQLSVSYLPDVFGLTRRSVEAANAQVESSRFQLEATYLTLTSNVVTTAIQEASLRGQIAATRRMLELQHKVTGIVQGQKSLGAASDLDLHAQELLEAQTAQMLPPLQKQLDQARDALTALLGRLPSEEPEETFDLDRLTLPLELPVSVPSKLVEQRPDVRQAEENMHAASAEVGVALAAMLPQFPITAAYGSSALKAEQLFSGSTVFWTLGGSLTQVLFDAGALSHRHRAAEAALDQAAAQYRAAVILACQNVADALRALRADADAVKAGVAADNAAKATLELARQQYRLGTVSLVALLNAEQGYQQAELALIQARANRYSDTAGLFQSLGGGWWNRPEETTHEQPGPSRE